MKSPRKSSPAVTPRPETLTFYEVAEYGTISDPTVPGPRLRADVFQNISPGSIRTTEDLISEVDSCIPLASHFSILAADHLSDIEDELDEDDNGLGFVERRRLAFLAAALQYDPDTGWRDWIAHEGDPGLAGFKEIIQDWLDEDIDWDEADSFDSCWSGQGAQGAGRGDHRGRASRQQLLRGRTPGRDRRCQSDRPGAGSGDSVPGRRRGRCS
jgi:hypothetical protein